MRSRIKGVASTGIAGEKRAVDPNGSDTGVWHANLTAAMPSGMKPSWRTAYESCSCSTIRGCLRRRARRSSCSRDARVLSFRARAVPGCPIDA